MQGEQQKVREDVEEYPLVTIYLGDESWHDGPGWYYVIDEYPDEGSCGAFDTKEEAIKHAREDGYEVEP